VALIAPNVLITCQIFWFCQSQRNRIAPIIPYRWGKHRHLQLHRNNRFAWRFNWCSSKTNDVKQVDRMVVFRSNPRESKALFLFCIIHRENIRHQNNFKVAIARNEVVLHSAKFLASVHELSVLTKENHLWDSSSSEWDKA
jgi:hypothetical protein